MVEQALGYAERGWPVFRIKAGTKIPLDRWRRGPESELATTDAANILARWSKTPSANIGVETGGAIAGGYLAVLDADIVENLPEWVADFPTYSVVTPSGGRHYYYCTAKPVANSVSALAEGIDVRGVGGMVVAPPSVTNGTYTVLADRPVCFLGSSLLTRRRTRVPGEHGFRTEKFVPAAEPLTEGRKRYLVAYTGWKFNELIGGDHPETAFEDTLACTLTENLRVCFLPHEYVEYHTESVLNTIAARPYND